MEVRNQASQWLSRRKDPISNVHRGRRRDLVFACVCDFGGFQFRDPWVPKLYANASPSKVDQNKQTVLQAAISTYIIDLIQLLVDAGADVNAPAGPVFGRAALQKAAEKSNTEILKLILSHGADVNVPAGNSQGIKALQGAMMNDHLKIVLLLLKAGAQVSAPPASREGRTALDAAAEHGCLDKMMTALKPSTSAASEQRNLRHPTVIMSSRGF